MPGAHCRGVGVAHEVHVGVAGAVSAESADQCSRAHVRQASMSVSVSQTPPNMITYQGVALIECGSVGSSASGSAFEVVTR